MSHYRAMNSGHAGGHLRRMMDGLIQTGEVDVDELYNPSDALPDPVRWLTGQLWNCMDIMPGDVRNDTGDPPDQLWTYGQAARAIRQGALVVG